MGNEVDFFYQTTLLVMFNSNNSEEGKDYNLGPSLMLKKGILSA